ncbi:SDR family oxidoreductase [Pelagibacterium nitratireducens]|jgi:NAD(P)-dependent dehydrogenase (short-subunit alcohol dehydrogenase family)|uniref:SDR family oxidoreductase n=1 Tax=Pelagibacterium nitratireducens TaxID=1046114 RepID=A0ABZ2I1D8_9HYPH|nr:3-oxoacyl-ACP reductase [Pelagibacterium sp.]HCO54181.1 3-oxoacyl-ACP reductase [Pelagibacterium sp.]|tara:strand:- start:7475 stop:8221 length:747 start_codon:yes stop_codon:yes gene_type:complete
MKIAIVTGGGTGVGKAIAKALYADGFALALFGRRLDVLEATAGEIDAGGERVLAVSVDIGDQAAVEAAFKTVIGRWGRLDLLVNNAGMNAPSVALEDVTAAQWNQIVGANLSGAFFCTQFAFRQFKAQSPQGGRIINNGSISATTPRPQSAPYAATKHAISGLTKASALDGRAFNIAVGQIDIGNASTDMTTRMSSGVLQADGSMAIEPTIDAGHVAGAVSYMAALPLEANTLTMTVMATQMPFVGRG